MLKYKLKSFPGALQFSKLTYSSPQVDWYQFILKFILKVFYGIENINIPLVYFLPLHGVNVHAVYNVHVYSMH